MERHVQVRGTGRFVPSRCVTSSELDVRFGLPEGVVARGSGVTRRYHATAEETPAVMGARAVERALAAAGIEAAEVDFLVAASTIPQQPMPHGAALVLEALGWQHVDVPTLDCTAACFSSFAAIDLVSSAIHAGRFRTAVIVSTDVISQFLDPQDRATYALYGDLAAAVVLGRPDLGSRARILGSTYRTYAAGVHSAEIRGGGSGLPGHRYRPERHEDFLFRMDGDLILRLVIEHAGEVVGGLLKETGLSLQDIDVFVPHQTSAMTLKVMTALFPTTAAELVNVLADFGSVGAVTLPLALDEAARRGLLTRGTKVMTVMCGGGFSIGAMVLEF